MSEFASFNDSVRSDIAHLFKANHQRLLSFAQSYLERSEAEDAVQDCYLRLLSAKQQRRVSLPLLIRCVRNRCIDCLRRAWLTKQMPNVSEAIEERSYDPECKAEQKERHQAVCEFFDELSDEQRQLLTLKFSEMLPTTQIAMLMKVSRRSVYRRLDAIVAIAEKRLSNLR